MPIITLEFNEDNITTLLQKIYQAKIEMKEKKKWEQNLCLKRIEKKKRRTQYLSGSYLAAQRTASLVAFVGN